MTADNTTNHIGNVTLQAAWPVGPHGSSSDRSKSDLPLVVVDRDKQGNAVAQAVSRRRRWITRTGLFIIIVVAAIVAGGLIGLYRQPSGLQWAMQTLGLEPGAGTSSPIAVPVNSPQTRTPVPVGPSDVIALGRLVPKGKVVTVAPASGVRDARIAELKVAEGDHVESGQVLAVLDNEKRLSAAVESARTTVAVREATLQQTIASVRASLEEARAALARAEARQRRAWQDFERTERLFQKGITSKATYDEKLAALREAENEVEQHQATVSRYQGQISEQPDVIVARRNVEAAEAELQRAKEDLEQAYIRAPIDGRVLDIHARTGEKPGEQGVVELGNTRQMTAELEVYQSQIGKVETGDPVTLSALALPKKLTGEVSRIGLRVKRQSEIGRDPAANTDARVIEVIVTLDEASSAVASRFTDLQVEARIETGGVP